MYRGMNEAKKHLAYWSERLGVQPPVPVRVPRSRWSGDLPANGHHLFGYCRATNEFLYSRPPTQREIVHELCHAKWPQFSEEEVWEITDALLW